MDRDYLIKLFPELEVLSDNEFEMNMHQVQKVTGETNLITALTKFKEMGYRFINKNETLEEELERLKSYPSTKCIDCERHRLKRIKEIEEILHGRNNTI